MQNVYSRIRANLAFLVVKFVALARGTGFLSWHGRKGQAFVTDERSDEVMKNRLMVIET